MERWQTFVAALLAFSAAWLAARPVQRQLAQQRRQSAAAASTVIAKSALALEDERAAMIKGKDAAGIMMKNLCEIDECAPKVAQGLTMNTAKISEDESSARRPRVDAMRELWKTGRIWSASLTRRYR
jgi:hypothetical protein